MIELLVLIVLFKESSTIYGVKRKIDKRFFLFFKLSFGSIHPALKRLEKDNYVELKNTLTIGGQKKSIYSITEAGKNRLFELMVSDLPENPALANQLIIVKLMFLHKLPDESRHIVINSLSDYILSCKNKTEESIKHEEIESKEEEDFFKFYSNQILSPYAEYLEKLK